MCSRLCLPFMSSLPSDTLILSLDTEDLSPLEDTRTGCFSSERCSAAFVSLVYLMFSDAVGRVSIYAPSSDRSTAFWARTLVTCPTLRLLTPLVDSLLVSRIGGGNSSAPEEVDSKGGNDCADASAELSVEDELNPDAPVMTAPAYELF